MFLEVPTAEGVLALMGMRTRYQETWAYDTLCAYALEHANAREKKRGELEVHVRNSKRALAMIQAGSPSIGA